MHRILNVHHPFFEIVTDTKPDYSVNDALLIQYSRSFWGYVVYNTTTAAVYEWKIFERKSDDSIFADQVVSILSKAILNHSFQFVRVLSYSPRTIFIPDVLKTAEEENACWNFTLGTEPDEIIHPYAIPYREGKYLLGLEKDFFDAINAYFQNVTWLPYAATHAQSAEHANLIRLTVIGHTMFIAVQKEQQWLLHQSYPFDTPEDMLYLLLKIFAAFLLDAETIVVEMDGFIDPESAITRLLMQYIRNINWISVQRFQFPVTSEQSFIQPLAHIDRILTCVS